jgi:hypothetical protein
MDYVDFVVLFLLILDLDLEVSTTTCLQPWNNGVWVGLSYTQLIKLRDIPY